MEERERGCKREKRMGLGRREKEVERMRESGAREK